MPIKSEIEHLQIPRDLKRSVKVSNEQINEIREIHNLKLMSQRKIAKLYNISRRLVYFIVNPEKYEEYKIAYKAKGGSMQYYDKVKQRIYVQRTRAHRKQIENKLIKKKEN